MGKLVSKNAAIDELLKLVVQEMHQVCVECNRVFDMYDEQDAAEFYYGHDCESN